MSLEVAEMWLRMFAFKRDRETSWNFDKLVGRIVRVIGREEILELMDLGCIKLLVCQKTAACVRCGNGHK